MSLFQTILAFQVHSQRMLKFKFPKLPNLVRGQEVSDQKFTGYQHHHSNKFLAHWGLKPVNFYF